jgi:hypothetical protein
LCILYLNYFIFIFRNTRQGVADGLRAQDALVAQDRLGPQDGLGGQDDP